MHGAQTKPGAVYYPTQSKAAAVVAGDASDKAVCAYTVSGPDLYMREPLPLESRSLSSGHRELLTVRSAIEKYGYRFNAENDVPKTILWLTDSTNLTAFLEKGSPKLDIQDDILRVFRACRERGTLF